MDGSWRYALDDADPDTDALREGQTATDTFEIASLDGTAARVAITVKGSNDAAAIGGVLTGTVTEDYETAMVARGTLTADDPDAGEDGFQTQSGVVGRYGTFALGADGAWNYTLDNADPDTDALDAGQMATDIFEVASLDGTPSRVTITVTGSDDAATIGGVLVGTVTEDDETATVARGTLTVDDPDAGRDGFRSETGVAGRYGAFTLGADGSWSYALNNADPDTDALREGETATDIFEAASLDGTVARVTITVTGSNDAAEIVGALSGTVIEDDETATAVSGKLTVDDPDASGDGLRAQTGVAGRYGTFTLWADGTWLYTLDNADPDTDALREGETATDIFGVASLDGTAERVTITVRGADETEPVVEIPELVPEIAPALQPQGEPETSTPATPVDETQPPEPTEPIPLPEREEWPTPAILPFVETPLMTIFDDDDRNLNAGYLLAAEKPEKNVFKLLGHWTMDRLDGNLLHDQTGGGRYATFFSDDGAPQLVEPDTGDPFGAPGVGKAARLEGTAGSYIVIPHEEGFEVQKGTIMFWFNADDIVGRQTLFAKNAAGPGNHLTIALDGARVEVRMEDGRDSHVILTEEIVRRGVWHHLSFSFGPGGMELHLDGALVGENAATVGLTGNREPIVIGGSNHLNEDPSVDPSGSTIVDPFRGLIRDIKVYGQDLDTQQALHLRERDTIGDAGPEYAVPLSASTGGDWAWDVEISDGRGEGARDISVRATQYVPVPHVPDWVMGPHETGFDDGEVPEFLAGALVGPALHGLRRSARRANGRDAGELIG